MCIRDSFSRANVWVQVGPPETWAVSVPRKDEALAIGHPEAYKHEQRQDMPAAQRWYASMQQAFPEETVDLPVQGRAAKV
eukprot:8911795-Prorocentrum_lima.AAC.1